jgi:hypothetical protein
MVDTVTAFARGEAARAAGSKGKVFDWDKAARIIRERNVTNAEAGLSGDLEWTGGPIVKDGKPVPADDTYTYLASVWATPVLIIDGDETDCWISADKTDWTAKTYWPDSARAILNEAPAKKQCKRKSA